MVEQGFCGAMGNYAFENLNSFFHQINEIPVQTTTSVRQPLI